MVSPGVDLTGRSAIVTGSNQGLGLAIAESFLVSGANVLLMARDAAKLDLARQELSRRARPGQTVHAVPGDVARPEDCASAVDAALKHFGGLTILVNNAGVYGPMGRLEDVDWKEWEDAIRINLLGTVLMCRAALQPMRARGYGKIVNLSGGGATGPLPRFSAYAASKAAVVRLTETLAEEVRGDHIDVNAIAPGALNTRLLDQVLLAGPDKVGPDFHARALKQRDEGGAPLEKGAALAAFLASAQSDGITGRLLSAVWDDWERLAERRADLQGSDVYTLRRIVPKDRGFEW
jgi:NAD(P)-dependent dehydrogenase (short-subunit alcohol dehydrogenase family)